MGCEGQEGLLTEDKLGSKIEEKITREDFGSLEVYILRNRRIEF